MSSCATSQDGEIRRSTKPEKEKLPKNVSKEIPIVPETSKGVAKKMVTIEAFTPSVLNNQIVAMRKIVKVAHLHTVRKTNRQLKNLKSRLEKKASEKMKKQIDKLEGDLVAMKTIKKDEVSKFALINKDSLDTLLNKPNTSPSERVLFKLATCPSVQSNVKAFRLSHPGSDVSCAFMLQRLGLQYQALRAEKVGDKLKKKLKSGEICDLTTESDAIKDEKTPQISSDQLEEKKEKSVIEKVLTKSIEKAKKEEKKTALTKKKKGEKMPEAPIIVKPIEIVKPVSKEAVVKKLNLRGDESDESDNEIDDDDDDDIDMESEDEMDDNSEEEDESEEDSEKEEGDEKSYEEEEEESDKEEDTTNDGLSAFFLNTDGTSREVITSEMKDVEDDEDEGKMRGGMRGMKTMRGGMRGRDREGKERMNGGDRGRGRDGNAQRVGRGRGSDRGRGGERGRGGQRGRGEKIDGSLGSVPSQSSSSSMGEQLHPSWIAKQKQKEMMKAGPSGKKITFD
ncbi:hypothetical protein PRIPAC_84468 [Pristionchus pacificus]|uniref:Serum response factor-binding protein 1 n=1 Tax=Pristionchus pacificus TaxID=54126 RepID=A0A2A6CC33_PRIPA|nr:hypothetical protein PRIPAC_84468 [Pristionchus pacificus]|eukprot:PDM75676.1 hypothetical protein PRIPAC_43812 [Pristionchus pacificus]